MVSDPYLLHANVLISTYNGYALLDRSANDDFILGSRPTPNHNHGGSIQSVHGFHDATNLTHDILGCQRHVDWMAEDSGHRDNTRQSNSYQPHEESLGTCLIDPPCVGSPSLVQVEPKWRNFIRLNFMCKDLDAMSLILSSFVTGI